MVSTLLGVKFISRNCYRTVELLLKKTREFIQAKENVYHNMSSLIRLVRVCTRHLQKKTISEALKRRYYA